MRTIHRMEWPTLKSGAIALIFTWRVMNKVAMDNGVVFEDVIELITYDTELLTATDIHLRKRRVNR